MNSMVDFFANLFEGAPVINVGTRGGDVQTRWFTAIMIAMLIILVAPPTGVADATLRVVTLAAAMTGTIFLMTGLVFAARTHYAGIVLTTVPLIVKLLITWQARWLAVVIGLLALGGSILNLSTRRCGLNKLLRISSA